MTAVKAHVGFGERHGGHTLGQSYRSTIHLHQIQLRSGEIQCSEVMTDGEWTGPSVGEIRLDSVWSVLSDFHYSSAHLLQGGAVPNHQPATISPSSPAGPSPPPSLPPSLFHLCFNLFMLYKKPSTDDVHTGRLRLHQAKSS